jgi:hypothetical protein
MLNSNIDGFELKVRLILIRLAGTCLLDDQSIKQFCKIILKIVVPARNERMGHTQLDKQSILVGHFVDGFQLKGYVVVKVASSGL